MQIVRTIIWVMILFGILTFSFFNWDSVEVNLWENLVLETKIPVLVITAFLLGLVPTWLYHRSVKWSLDRRVRSLEASIKSNALAHRQDNSSASSQTSAHTASPTAAHTGTAAHVDKTVQNPAKAGDSLAPAPATDPAHGQGGSPV